MCPGHEGEKDVGACQIKNGSQTGYVLGKVNSSLHMSGGLVRVEYGGGQPCHHIQVSRKAVVTFECDSRQDFLEVLPEEECEYSFVVHTKLVCGEGGEPGVECAVPLYGNLGTLSSAVTLPSVVPDNGGLLFISACVPNSHCPSGAAACLKKE